MISFDFICDELKTSTTAVHWCATPIWGSARANITHLVGLALLLLLLLLLLVLLLVSAVTSFGNTSSAGFALSGLPGGVPAPFGVGLSRIGYVGV